METEDGGMYLSELDSESIIIVVEFKGELMKPSVSIKSLLAKKG